jgi:hypothetical protein
MSGKTKLIFALALIITLGAFAFFILSNADKRALTGQRILPDGSTLRLGAIQFTNGNFSYTATGITGWRARVCQIFPKSWVTKFGWMPMRGSITFGSGGIGTNLCVFTVHEEPARNARFDDMRLMISDDLGNHFDAGTTRGVMTTSDMINELRVDGWCPPAFPRRGKTLDLRFYKRDESNAPCLAEFIIPNPAPGNYPTWTPQPLPATRTDGDLSITLTSLKSGLSKSDKTGPAASNEVAVTQAAFRVVQTGSKTNAWRPKQVEIRDATGNRWIPYPHMVSSRHEDGVDYLSIDGALWPGEAAWKMRFEFSRIADYEPAEIVTFSNIIVPGATQLINLDNTTNVGESKLQLVAISGEMAEQPGNLKWSMVKKHTNLSIRATPLPDGYRLALLKVTDDSGREADIKREPDWNPPERVYGFKTPDGAKRLNFTFALHKSRFVEFVARPEFVRKN